VNLGNFARRDGNGRDLLPALVQDRDTPFRRTRRRVGSDLPRDDFARCPSPPPRHGSPHLRDRLIDHRYLDRNNIAACYYLSHLSKTNATTSFPFRLERTAPRQLEIRIMFLGGLRALPRPNPRATSWTQIARHVAIAIGMIFMIIVGLYFVVRMIAL